MMKDCCLPLCPLYIYWSHFARNVYLTISSLPHKVLDWRRVKNEMLYLFPENYLFSASWSLNVPSIGIIPGAAQLLLLVIMTERAVDNWHTGCLGLFEGDVVGLLVRNMKNSALEFCIWYCQHFNSFFPLALLCLNLTVTLVTHMG